MSETIKLRLTNTDEVTLIDASDYEKIKDVNWHKSSYGYAVKNLYIGDGKWKGLRLHRVILDAPDGVAVDHINRNRLDNRRSNLRLATALENNRNVSRSKNNSTGFKGVSVVGDKYVAHVRVDGTLMHLGHYEVLEDAAKAYNVMAEKYFGEFAALNDVDHVGFQIKEKAARYSEYKGVSFHSQRHKWYASFYKDKKQRHVGSYLTEKEAAIAYNEFALKELGEFAQLNVIREEANA